MTNRFFDLLLATIVPIKLSYDKIKRSHKNILHRRHSYLNELNLQQQVPKLISCRFQINLTDITINL